MRKIKDGVMIVVEVAAGFLAGLYLFGLIPGDRINMDVVGSLVLAAVFGTLSYLAAYYRKLNRNA